MASRSGDAREVSWLSWIEWDHVRKLLYSFNDSKRQVKGINMVNVWRSRLSYRGLPVSVDLTAALVAAYVGNATSTYGNEFQAQMSSAMAILRFVNGVTDKHQSGIYAQSVQEIADKINIPDWMVDLRHESAHAKLPSFELLKQGLVIALNWLDLNYWEETAAKLVQKEEEFFLNLNKGIKDYVDAITQVVLCDNKNSHKSIKDQNRMKQKKTEKCGEISRHLHRYIHVGNIKQFINTLLQEGFFVFTQGQMQSLGIKNNTAEYLLNEASIYKLICLSGLWKVLIDSFLEIYPSFLELISQELVKLTKQYETSKSYVNYLLSMFILFKCNNKVDKTLLYYLMKNPSHLGYQILEVIVEEGRLSTDMKTKIILFLNIFKPVIYVLNRKSNSYDPHKLYVMGTEASEKGKEIVSRLKEALREKPIKSEDLSTWSTISSLSGLPPMGEFTNSEKLFHLDPHNFADCPLEKVVCESLVIEKKEDNENDNLTDVIDNLFMDDTVYVGDHDSSSSSSTDEYFLDKDTAWDEDVDFNIDDKDSIKRGLGGNFFLHRPKNFEDCDISKVIFF